MAKTDGVARIIALAALGKDGGGSTGGTTNYLELANKPKINDVELTGNKTLEDLGINIPDLENYYTKEEINNTFPTTEAVDKTFEASWKETKEYIDASSCYDYTTLIDIPSGKKNDDRTLVRFPVSEYNELCKQYGEFLPIKLHLGWVFYKGSTLVYPSIDNGALKLTGTYNDGDISVTIRINGDTIKDAVVGELQDFDFWIMSSLKVTYTAGSNISISNDNVIDAGNPLYTFDTDELYSVTEGELFETGKLVLKDIINKKPFSIMVRRAEYYGNSADYRAVFAGNVIKGIESSTTSYTITVLCSTPIIESRPFYPVIPVRITLEYDQSTKELQKVTFQSDRQHNFFLSTANTKSYTPTSDYHPATKKYVDDNVKVYTAGENITISEDNVISANVSGGTDANAVYTYYAPYSDEDWFTEENVANILQTVKDKGYSNFELCTLNGSHYALRKGGNLQTLTTTEEYYDLEYLQNDLKYYTFYTFSAKLDENGKIVAGHLLKNDLTAEEVLHNLLPLTLKDFPGYDSSASHLMLQSNEGNIEWGSSLDGGVFGDSYTDPTYYTEKQVDKIVTDTVNEVLGGKY